MRTRKQLETWLTCLLRMYESARTELNMNSEEATSKVISSYDDLQEWLYTAETKKENEV